MANVQVYEPFNMLALQAFYGEVSRADAGEIIVQNGDNSARYIGSFSYSGENVFGSLSELQLTLGGKLVLSASGFTASASQIQSYIDSNRLIEAFSVVLSSQDTIVGSSGNDVLASFAGNDRILAGSGNDILDPGAGSDFVDGGDGRDAVYLAGSRGSYTIGISGNSASATSAAFTKDSLVNVERLVFTDGVLALDVGAGQTAGTAYRIYQAAFDRVPDGGGLAYHIDNLDSGASFTRMADIFVNSAEFNSVYGSNVSNADYIGRLYDNVLGRAGEAGGVAFWIGELESGARTKAEVLIGFADSPENIALTGVATQNGVFYPGEYGGV